MSKRLSCVLIAALLSCPAAAAEVAPAKSGDYATVGLWHVSKYTRKPACFALMALGDIATGVQYDAKTGGVQLVLFNENATSVADGQKLKLKIIFTTGKQIDEGWGEREFTSAVGESGSRMFYSEPFTKQMLDDLAKQDYLLVQNGERLVSGAKLEQSAAMVAKLKQCSIEAAGLNKDDPFLP